MTATTSPVTTANAPATALPDGADLHATVAALIAAHRDEPGALLPLLHAVQDALGHVPDAVVPALAQALNLSRAEVHGVLTYYPFFRRVPAGRHVVQVCQGEACLACGGEALLARTAERLGCAPHATRADGAVTLEPVYCLGLCASSPALQIDDRPHARVGPERLETLLAGIAAPEDAR